MPRLEVAMAFRCRSGPMHLLFRVELRDRSVRVLQFSGRSCSVRHFLGVLGVLWRCLERPKRCSCGISSGSGGNDGALSSRRCAVTPERLPARAAAAGPPSGAPDGSSARPGGRRSSRMIGHRDVPERSGGRHAFFRLKMMPRRAGPWTRRRCCQRAIGFLVYCAMNEVFRP
jgi:hypothetical protein